MGRKAKEDRRDQPDRSLEEWKNQLNQALTLSEEEVKYTVQTIEFFKSIPQEYWEGVLKALFQFVAWRLFPSASREISGTRLLLRLRRDLKQYRSRRKT
jgi:hypothetical protein